MDLDALVRFISTSLEDKVESGYGYALVEERGTGQSGANSRGTRHQEWNSSTKSRRSQGFLQCAFPQRTRLQRPYSTYLHRMILQDKLFICPLMEEQTRMRGPPWCYSQENVQRTTNTCSKQSCFKGI